LAVAENGVREDANINEARLRQELDQIGDDNDGMAAQARASITARIDTLSGQDPGRHKNVVLAAEDELALREREALKQAIHSRIEADKLPWTMPNPVVSPDVIAAMKSWYEAIVVQDVAPQPDDVFRVPVPMSGHYAQRDEELLTSAGIDPNSPDIKREQLQAAKIFFINRVGEGEQPILGESIPDPESPDGVFSVGERSFLTREELEKVYQYQKDNGYGIGNYDPTDVQTDMVMLGLRCDPRVSGVKIGGITGREDKRGLCRSPFVDIGFAVADSSFGAMIVDNSGLTFGRGQVRRMNTLSTHLVNAHPEFPGLGEMFDDSAAFDQRYLGPGEFVRGLYVPPPTEEEVLTRMKSGSPTRREVAWVGELQDS
jgi:hypothetical protein